MIAGWGWQTLKADRLEFEGHREELLHQVQEAGRCEDQNEEAGGVHPTPEPAEVAPRRTSGHRVPSAAHRPNPVRYPLEMDIAPEMTGDGQRASGNWWRTPLLQLG